MTIIENIEIIGRGNVATHLKRALNKFSVNVVNPHTLENLDRSADLIIISVKDDAITEISEKIGETDAIVVHTSGTTEMDVLDYPGRKYGVFYPLQTFSKDVELVYERIPFFIEGCNEQTECSLTELANQISKSVYTADSSKRRILHIASVFACNFVNHLWGASNKILSDNDIPFSVVVPLIEETMRKATLSGDPYSVQTGPAIRGDRSVMSRHLEMLKDYPELKKLYRTLSESIQSV